MIISARCNKICIYIFLQIRNCIEKHKMSFWMIMKKLANAVGDIYE